MSSVAQALPVAPTGPVDLPAAGVRLGLGSTGEIGAVLLLLLAGCALALTVNGYWVFVIANVELLAIVGIGLNVLIGLNGQVSFGHVGLYAIGAYAVAILMVLVQRFYLIGITHVKLFNP